MTQPWTFEPNPELLARIRAAAAEGVADATELVFEASQDDVPVDHGDLKRSGHQRADGLHGEIGYRDPVSIIVHENMRARHRRGRAKFLEDAMNTQRDAARQKIGDRLKPLFD